jgi:hypothetical protein
VANTDKQNFRYAGDRWKLAVAKTERMREQGFVMNDGYGLDMTALLAPRVDEFLGETDAQTAKRLGMTKADEPAKMRRRARAPQEAR